MKIALIRHGKTAWNAQGRVQGSIETDLSDEGRALLAGLRLPDGFATARPFCSPQRRARQTAALLGMVDPTIDPRLREQNWGDWEGMTRAQMMQRDGEACFETAGRGWDFCPPGGESSGALATRVRAFLNETTASNTDAVAITHMGVIRIAYALASGWDLIAPMPHTLDLSCALVVERQGETLSIAALNVPLPLAGDEGTPAIPLQR